ncbi:hypothetical protein CPT_Melville_096 [Salmonella phage Melville]|uniref:Uncharacterized protein n=1 Tax=Salmonella phage Melville TaxID=2041413 RepID=A0A2D1GM50_9CAUD|nr:hypothetical protein FDI73_gp096 [Salmonella phage Melville]ATN93070.1 hypothetical protein CPT_Melville_096 [Salmonella phage Melville]UPW42469.1 hypothetical protein EBPHNEJP_00171 [Salmonella phage CF-SP2]
MEEKVIDYGGKFNTVERSISYNNEHNKTMLRLDFNNGEIVGASFDFNGTYCSGNKSTVEELVRLKMLLNSFPNL